MLHCCYGQQLNRNAVIPLLDIEMKYILDITTVIIVMFFNLSCSTDETSDLLSFQFEKQSTLIIKDTGEDNNHFITSRYISLLPPDFVRNYVKAELIKITNEYILTFNLSSPSETEIIINSVRLYVFLIPGDTLYMTLNIGQLNESLANIHFNGKYATINEYKLKRRQEYGENFEQKCAKLFNAYSDTKIMHTALDSVKALELNFLNSYSKSSRLPKWYLNYETNQIIYNSVFIKIAYKEPQQYKHLLNEIEIDNVNALFCSNYYGFLNIHFENLFIKEMLQKDVAERKKEKGLRYLKVTDSLLTGEVKEIYKTYIISSFIIDFGLYELASKIIAEEKGKMNEKYIKYLEGYLDDRMKLKSGVKAPQFYLKNINNEFLTLSHFKESVLLLNFWFPGCKPCLLEIPFEKELVKTFKDRNFHLINICFYTTEENWQKSVNQLEMEGINLFANENWQKKLIESYKIMSYPHYTLIDKNGNIFSNNPKRPSEGVLEDILSLLNN